MAEKKSPRFFYGYVVALAAFFILAIMEGAMYTYGVFLKPLLAEFGWTRAAISGAFSLFMVLFGLFFVITGRLNDRFGPRIVVTVCGFFLGLGYLLMSQINAIWQLYLFYGVIIAIGMSGGFVPLVSTVARWFVKRRGLMTGLVVSSVGVGTVIMPPIANWLISSYVWRDSYTIIGIAALVVIVLAAQLLKRDPGQVGQLPYGESGIKEGSLNLEAIGFSLRQAIHVRQFWILGSICLFFSFFLQAIMVHIVPHATELGIPSAIAASVLAAIGGVSIAGRIVMGGAGDKIGNRLAMSICFFIIAIVLFWLLAAKELWMLYLFATIFGFAYGGFTALESPMVAELFGLGSHGVILGCIGVGATIGGAIGPVLAGYIFDVTGSYYQAFQICAAIAVIGFILTLFLKPIVAKA